jgi:hypothetical protein
MGGLYIVAATVVTPCFYFKLWRSVKTYLLAVYERQHNYLATDTVLCTKRLEYSVKLMLFPLFSAQFMISKKQQRMEYLIVTQLIKTFSLFQEIWRVIALLIKQAMHV